jgi:hypothetical protein
MVQEDDTKLFQCQNRKLFIFMGKRTRFLRTYPPFYAERIWLPSVGRVQSKTKFRSGFFGRWVCVLINFVKKFFLLFFKANIFNCLEIKPESRHCLTLMTWSWWEIHPIGNAFLLMYIVFTYALEMKFNLEVGDRIRKKVIRRKLRQNKLEQ